MALFLTASLVVILSPGQDMVLVFSRGLGQGARAGIATAAGVSTGLLGHTMLAAFGLGAISDVGDALPGPGSWAPYLIYLGVRMLLAGASHLDGPASPGKSLPRLFREARSRTCPTRKSRCSTSRSCRNSCRRRAASDGDDLRLGVAFAR
jgi:threonine/homoserine/homoserine lactone efflux protein